MSYGLELRDASGNITLTIDDRVTFFLDKRSVNVINGTSQTFSYNEDVMGASMISVAMNTETNYGFMSLQPFAGQSLTVDTNNNTVTVAYDSTNRFGPDAPSVAMEFIVFGGG